MPAKQYTDVEKIHLDSEFRELRRKVAFANVSFFVFFFASLFPLLHIKDEAFRIGLVTLWGVGGFALIRYNRRLWRCPACSQRWEVQQIFASTYWDYCPKCAAPLRRVPRLSRQTNLDEHEIGELQRKFTRNQQWGKIALALFFPLLIALLVVLDAKGFNDSQLQLVGIIFGGIYTTIYFVLSRCVNCKRAVMLGSAKHCYLCGVKLK